MKNTRYISILSVIILFWAAVEPVRAAEEFISIEKVLAQNKVKAQFTGLGMYSGACIRLDLENLTGDTTRVVLEPGRRLDNPDPQAQDILVLKELQFVLLPYQKQTGTVTGFCCQAGNHAPAAGTAFGAGQMAGGNLQWIAEFMNRQTFDVSTMQQTVWVFSDQHSPAAIVSNKDPKIMALRKAVADRLGIVLPWYDIHYKKESDRVFSGKHVRLTGDVKFSATGSGFALINVRNQQGLLMTTLADDMGVNARSYSYPVDIPVENWASGKYYVNVYVDGNLRQRREFIL